MLVIALNDTSAKINNCGSGIYMLKNSKTGKVVSLRETNRVATLKKRQQLGKDNSRSLELTWKIIYPDGKTIIIRNLTQFFRKNGWTNATRAAKNGKYRKIKIERVVN